MREHIGKRVFVYYNLHKHTWSVRCEKSKRVIAHVDSIVLTDVVYKVSKKGRERVLKEKRKNVHAGVQGTILGFYNIEDLTQFHEVTYNPYKYESFVYKDCTGLAAQAFSMVYMNKRRVFEQTIDATLKVVV